jgi:hypothetical protein
MKNTKMMRSLAAMSLVIGLFAGKSMATHYQLPAGSFTVMVSGLGGAENPNGYPVVIVGASQLANGLAGFLLNGSESASNWLKTLQDARLNNRQVKIWTDDNWSHAYDGQITENGYTGGAYKILAMEIMP